MSKTRKTRKRVSKKYKRTTYKGGTEQDKKRVEKLHKENEEMFKKFSGIMEDWDKVNQKMKDKHTNKEFKEKPLIVKRLPMPVTKDRIALAAATSIVISDGISIEIENNKIKAENKKMKEHREGLFKTVDNNKDLKETLSSIIEKTEIIEKKKGLLEDILKMDQVSVEMLQNAIKEVDTDAESLILDIKKVPAVLTVPLTDIKTTYSNIENRIKNKLDMVGNVFNMNTSSAVTAIYTQIINLTYNLTTLIANAVAAKKEITKQMETIKDSTKGLKTNDPKYKEYYEMLDKLNEHHTDQANIELGYKKEDDNFDDWLKGNPKQLIELKKLVENNNKLLKDITGKLNTEGVVENIDKIKEAIKKDDEDDDSDEEEGDEVMVEIVTNPYAQQFFDQQKNPDKYIKDLDETKGDKNKIMKYTKKITVKNKKRKGVKRGFNDINNSLYLFKNHKNINKWVEQKKTKKIKAFVSKDGVIDANLLG